MATISDVSVTTTHQSHTRWHHLDFWEVVLFFHTNLETGLSSHRVQCHQADFGGNELIVQPRKSPWLQFVLQFQQPLLYILLLTGGIKAVVGSWTSATVIWSVVVLNAAIGYVLSKKAEGAISALTEVVNGEATVLRDGKRTHIAAKELVPGDVVLLTSGDKVPADLRLVNTRNLEVDESALTGESILVTKSTLTLDINTPLAQRNNIAYAGTTIISGSGSGIVVATGKSTEMGQISQFLEQQVKLSTPLARKFDQFSRTLVYVILALASLTFVVGLGQGRSWVEMFDAAVALAVSAIPEGLPAVITVTLAIAVARMVHRGAFIRHLPSVETLGSTTVIFLDKTGTLTENQMIVQQVWAGDKRYRVDGAGYSLEGSVWQRDNPQPVHFGGRFLSVGAPNLNSNNSPSQESELGENYNIALRECLIAGLLCNDSRLTPKDNQWHVLGDPTEGASVVVARKAGLSQSKLTEAMPRLDSLPVEAQFHYKATLHGIRVTQDKRQQILPFIPDSSTKTIYVKGSVEAVMNRCQQMLDNNGNVVHLDRASVELQLETMVNCGLRVLAFAKKLVGSDCNCLTHEHLESGLIFLGLQGMIDPPRQEIIASLRACRYAGIQVKMITGDHISTAVAIAQRLGLQKDGELVAFEGQQLAQMNDADLARAAEIGAVFALVTPEQRRRLVEALQSLGEIVAMRGDGISDAAALKQADIGIATGITGGDVGKEVADMVLLENNFAIIEAAVEEGRTVYQNLRKAIAFILPVNGGESMTILLCVLMSREFPILALQILWLNMVNSVAMTVPLAFEPKSNQVMNHPPRNPREPLVSRQLLWRILVVSIFNWVLIFAMFEWVHRTTGDIAVARTMAITALIAAKIFYLLSISQWGRTIIAKLQDKRKAIQYSPAIAIGIFCTIILQIIFSQWNVMNTLFDTAPLSLSQWLICVIPALAMIPLAAVANRVDPID
jgi:cation-transporting ATPase F